MIFRQRRGHPGGRGWRGPTLAASAIAVAILAACGGSGGSTPTSRPASGAASVAPSAGASASGSLRPRATPWPGNTVLGIKALGAADAEILKAIADLGQGIQAEDLGQVREAAEGLAAIDVLLPNVDRVRLYPPMDSFADRLDSAIRTIDAAATALRDAIRAGDGPTITRTTQELIDALKLYIDVQPELARWVADSIEQQRLLAR